MNSRFLNALKVGRSLAAMVIVAALAVYVYDYYQRTTRQDARTDAALIREQTQVLRQQAQELNQRLRSVNEEAVVLRDEVAGQRHEVEQHKARQLAARSLAEGLQMAAPARVAIAESYLTNLRWPTSNQEAGIPAAAEFKGGSLQRMQISKKGIITLTFDAQSGVEGGTIELIPAANAATGAISWRCQSPSYPEISALIPQCVYEAAHTAPPG